MILERRLAMRSRCYTALCGAIAEIGLIAVRSTFVNRQMLVTSTVFSERSREAGDSLLFFTAVQLEHLRRDDIRNLTAAAGCEEQRSRSRTWCSSPCAHARAHVAAIDGPALGVGSLRWRAMFASARRALS
jgi:hypothetical protein